MLGPLNLGTARLHKRLLLQHCRGVVFSVLFHPKQLTVVSGGDDAEVRVWDLVDKSCIAVLKVRRKHRKSVAWQISQMVQDILAQHICCTA